MGFLDKAKKMAEQAQAKLDEAQKQYNAGQGTGSATGPAVEYDQHGRPIPSAPPATATPPHGDTLTGGEAGAVSGSAPAPDAGVPPETAPARSEQGWAPPSTPAGDDSWAPPGADAGTTPSGAPFSMPSPPPSSSAAPSSAPPPSSAPARAGSQGVPEDRNNPSYEPPTLTSGDPLAG